MPTLLGHSMGCQVIMEYYKHFPNDVRALIPMFGTFARPLDTFMDFRYSRIVFEGFRRLAEVEAEIREGSYVPCSEVP